MGTISRRDFDIRQPYFPETSDCDDFYYGLANLIEDRIGKNEYGQTLSQSLRGHLALTLTGYLQDIVNDAGLWRSFVDTNRKLYGWTVPFHETGPDYTDYELNREDIRFLVWYDIAMMDIDRRALYPLDDKLMAMADDLWKYIDRIYDDCPMEVKYDFARGLSMTDPADQEEILHVAYWLFNNSWLLTPAFALSLNIMANMPDVKEDKDGILLNKRIDAAVSEDTVGPLALYTQEWVYLLLNGKLPATAKDEPDAVPGENNHPYYDKFVAATGGKHIAYFADYDSMNRFFIEALGWEKDTEHLSQVKNGRDFVLLVNPKKGMLMARNVAKCIADPENPLYDKLYARKMAIELLAVRGLCPVDLLKYVLKHGWLPDACFPDSDNTELVARNADFIARCYLQDYYRGD